MKTTNDLMNILNEIDSDKSLDEYLEKIEKYKDLNYLDYYLTVIKDHSVSKNDVVKDSGLNRTYCCQMLNGTRKPGRDNAIALCIAGKLNIAETVRYLELLELATLYPKDMRDSIIIYSINRGLTITETNELLYSKKEKTLGE